jgi:lysophospholipase L1-like esterase
MRIRSLSPILLMLCLVAGPPVANGEDFFKKGDRIVFLGDSITEQYQYSNYLELYLTTRHPDWNLFFLNAGIGGDTANGGAGRFQSHVLDEQPTAVTINFGMNDAGYGKFDANRNKQYVQKTEQMLEMAKKANVRVALLSPNAVDRRGRENFKLYVETQKEFYAPLKGLAEKHGFRFADQYAVTRAAIEKMEADKADKVIPYYDGFHTSPPGGLLMAHAILTGLDSPAKVSGVTIDAAASKIDAENATAGGLKVSDTVVSFTRTDKALPFPVQNDWKTILPYVNDLKDLNDYSLIIKGLKNGIWEIRIDGKPVLQVSADDLARGVNLGNVTTGPVFEHSQKVFNAIVAKNQIVHGRFRGVILAQVPEWLADVAKERKPAELKKRLELITAKQQEIWKLATPVEHAWEVSFVK